MLSQAWKLVDVDFQYLCSIVRREFSFHSRPHEVIFVGRKVVTSGGKERLRRFSPKEETRENKLKLMT